MTSSKQYHLGGGQVLLEPFGVVMVEKVTVRYVPMEQDEQELFRHSV